MIEDPDNKQHEPSSSNSLPTTRAVSPEDETAMGLPMPTQSTLPVQHSAKTVRPHEPRIKHEHLLGANSIAFYIGDLDDPLVMQVTEQITLGRYEALTSPQPSLDLTPYQAVELGVSRLHAAIRRQQHDLLFEDMGSSNGSSINTERIAPHVPHRLQSGDVIVLLAEEVSVVQADNLQKLEGLVVLQAIRGTIHFSVPNLDKPTQVEAQLVMYVRKGAGVDSPQSLEIAIDTDLNRTTPPIKELLERALKFAEFNLTLK